MSRLRELGLGPRIVIVIGLAMALAVVAGYVVTDGYRAVAPNTWFAYAPGTDVYFSNQRVSAVRTVVAPLAAVVIWTAASAWLLGAPRSRAE